MAYLVPEDLARLQAMALVHDAELQAIGAENILRHASRSLAEQAVHKLITDCIKVEPAQELGYTGKCLRLDVYVIHPQELYRLLAQAAERGARDGMYWPVVPSV